MHSTDFPALRWLGLFAGVVLGASGCGATNTFDCSVQGRHYSCLTQSAFDTCSTGDASQCTSTSDAGVLDAGSSSQVCASHHTCTGATLNAPCTCDDGPNSGVSCCGIANCTPANDCEAFCHWCH